MEVKDMKKRIIALILACLMVISTILTGCISASNPNDPGNLDDVLKTIPFHINIPTAI